MKTTLSYISIIALAVMDGCIDPFDVERLHAKPVIVVDGLLTDQPGPHTVSLYYSLDIDEQLSAADKVTGAEIYLNDDQGYREKLKEMSAGKYSTSNGFHGTIGSSYYIDIRIPDGSQYESIPEKLVPAGQIDNVYFEFEQVEVAKLSDSIQSRNGFNIFVDATLDPSANNLIRWRTTGVFQLFTAPKKHMRDITPPNSPVPVYEPDPLPCSGYVWSRTRGFQFVRACSCCDCWVTLPGSKPLLIDEAVVFASKIQRHKIAFIPASKRFFYDKYYFQLEQLSVSTNVFDFWKAVREQEKISSDLFQTPGVKTTGNIRPVGNVKSQAVGMFAVSAVTTKSLFIDRTSIPYVLAPIDSVPESCMQLYQNTTNVKPLFW